jgi:hypothetical protein
MTYKTTVVTMYFNLKNLKDTTSGTRSIDFYLKNGRGTLQQKNPMLIFCDETTKPLIQQIRDELVDPTQIPTIYIERDITDYDFYKYNWPIIVENRRKSTAYKNPHDRNTPSYFLLTMFKIFALQTAYERDDFSTNYIAWMDFGCMHVAGTNLNEAASQMINNPHPRISVCYINYRSSNELKNMEAYCNKGPCGIAATAFTVERAYMTKFYTLMLSIFYEKLFKGIGHTEETIMAYCYDRHPELFNLYFGDYYSTITNYHYVVRDWHTVKWCFIEPAKNSGRLDLAKEAAKNIVDAVILKKLTMPDNEYEYMENILRL